MRTILNLDEDLAQRAEELVLREGSTPTWLIEEGLRLRLRPAPSAPASRPLLPVFEGRGSSMPGADPLSNDASATPPTS